MAKMKTEVPQYGTIMQKGIQYYRTRIMDADGKQVSLYAATCEELYEKQLEARRQVEEIIFRRQHPTVAEYCQKWLLMQSAKVSASTLRGYTADMKNYIIKPLGEMYMEEVTADDIRLALVPLSKKSEGLYYYKEIEEITVRDFYQQMVDHPDVFPKTSMPSVQDFYEVFEKSVKENIPVICICITAKFSGSLQSATTAKDMILEEYPEAKIAVIDSTFDTVLQGLFVLEACRLRDLGLEYEQITEALLSIRESGRIFFTIGSIDYLKHGGRIGKLAGIAASALKIKPIITLKEGEIFNSGITRSRQKSMQKVVEMTEKYLDEVQAKPGEYSFCIGYGYDYEEAVGFREMLKDLIRERLGIEEIGIYQIGATIGVHTGPYPIGIGIVRHAEV